jgi:hypothetical protein
VIVLACMCLALTAVSIVQLLRVVTRLSGLRFCSRRTSVLLAVVQAFLLTVITCIVCGCVIV